ncbi:hypothetical protein SAMN04487833_12616 [Sarcina sp. DSM 11001]|nr:hypothetical protein SAMN04487833_12616 [Sarcina sp. DSM 11001]
MIVSVVRTQDIVRNDGVNKESQKVCTMHISARQTEGCIMFSKGKYRRRAEKPDNDEDGFCFFCRSVLKINMEITAFVVVCAIIFSILTPGNPVLNRFAPVLPGTEAWAYTGSGFNIGSQTAAETNRDMSSLMQGDEQAANNQAPGNVVNSGQGENIVNSQTPEGLVNGGQPQDAVNGQFPEGYVNGGQPQNAVNGQVPEGYVNDGQPQNAVNGQVPEGYVNDGQPQNAVNGQVPEGYVNDGQPQNAVNGQVPEGYVNDGQPQSPVEETEFFGRAKNPTALRSQKAFESGVGIIYALACMMILIAAWTMFLQDSGSNGRFRRKSRRRRRFWRR